MKRIKIKLCEGKCCRKALSAAERKAIAALALAHQDAVKLKECGCLGHCGKKKRGAPPFAEVGDRRLDAVSGERLRGALDEDLVRRRGVVTEP